MTPEQSQVYSELLARCVPFGIHVHQQLGTVWVNGGSICYVTLSHPSWAGDITRLLFPDGTLV